MLSFYSGRSLWRAGATHQQLLLGTQEGMVPSPLGAHLSYPDQDERVRTGTAQARHSAHSRDRLSDGVAF